MRDPLQPAETVEEGGAGAYEVGTLGCPIPRAAYRQRWPSHPPLPEQVT